MKKDLVTLANFFVCVESVYYVNITYLMYNHMRYVITHVAIATVDGGVTEYVC